MIAKVTGLLAEVGDDRVLIDRDGLGYEVLVPGYLAMQLSDCAGQPVTLFTMDYLEGSATSGNLIPRLAGFASLAEKAAFQQILSVKGFGVRKALKALAVPIEQVAAAIEQGDAVSLSRLPGVGKRTAEQIVATLRGKTHQDRDGRQNGCQDRQPGQPAGIAAQSGTGRRPAGNDRLGRPAAGRRAISATSRPGLRKPGIAGRLGKGSLQDQGGRVNGRRGDRETRRRGATTKAAEEETGRQGEEEQRPKRQGINRQVSTLILLS